MFNNNNAEKFNDFGNFFKKYIYSAIACMITEPTEKQYLPSSRNLGFLANVFGISWIILHFMPRFCIFLDYTKSLTKIAAIILAKKSYIFVEFFDKNDKQFWFSGQQEQG